MIRGFLLGLWLWSLALPVSGQAIPRPDGHSQRIQAVSYTQGDEVLLTMLPETPLTVVLDPRDEIVSVQPGQEGGFSIRVSADRDSFTILPLANDAASELLVKTAQREYRIAMRVKHGPEAALLVRYTYGQTPSLEKQLSVSNDTWRYRFRGDREVRPIDISDDGYTTRIFYGPDQALPAVFAIGPTGDEEVVNGYMRDGVFEIDRVYTKLVFRIDKQKATARRNAEPEAAS